MKKVGVQSWSWRVVTIPLLHYSTSPPFHHSTSQLLKRYAQPRTAAGLPKRDTSPTIKQTTAINEASLDVGTETSPVSVLVSVPRTRLSVSGAARKRIAPGWRRAFAQDDLSSAARSAQEEVLNAKARRQTEVGFQPTPRRVGFSGRARAPVAGERVDLRLKGAKLKVLR